MKGYGADKLTCWEDSMSDAPSLMMDMAAKDTVNVDVGGNRRCHAFCAQGSIEHTLFGPPAGPSQTWTWSTVYNSLVVGPG